MRTLWSIVLTTCLLEPASAQQSTTPNHVLELDGNGSYVDLPIAPLIGLKEFTVSLPVERGGIHGSHL